MNADRTTICRLSVERRPVTVTDELNEREKETQASLDAITIPPLSKVASREIGVNGRTTGGMIKRQKAEA